MSDQQDLTLGEVADCLGVHYQTVYRWVRSGRLPAVKIGGNYVVRRPDFDRFTEMRQRPASPPAPSAARLDRQRDAMRDALLVGDETAAQSIARRLISNGTSVTELIEEVLAPPLKEIGARWSNGEASISVEHRASAIVDRLLGEVCPNPRGRRRGRAMVAAVAGDFHSLPTSMATACLREDNWHVEHLGADMPVSELEAFAVANDLDVVVISATTSDDQRVEEIRVALEDGHGIPTLVGRPGAALTELKTLARHALAGARSGTD